MSGRNSTEIAHQDSLFWDWFKWSTYSPSMLRETEQRILSYLRTEYRGYFVDIGAVVSKTTDKIWTISLNETAHPTTTPVVMLHGMGAGSALWVLNLDEIARNRRVYSLDLLGFGRSSRPQFSNEPALAERQMVLALEAWREQMRLNDMILLGHSLGGFLATAYALLYPNRVRHLMLVDPWGFPEKPEDISTRYNLPFWVRAIAYVVRPLNPLWAVRVAGPFGPWLVQKARPDIMRKFSPLLGENTSIIGQYIYQCNAQNPSGESAFHAMMTGFGWAKRPMLPRMGALDPNVPISVVYGSRSWVDHAASDQIRAKRPPESILNVHVINGAGHHVYADRHDLFNRFVIETIESFNSSDNSATESQENLSLPPPPPPLSS